MCVFLCILSYYVVQIYFKRVHYRVIGCGGLALFVFYWMIMSAPLIPSQEKGKAVDLQETVTAGDEATAKKIFANAVHLLCRPGLWKEAAGSLSAAFSIDGKEETQPVAQCDHIWITIPGPGLNEGDGDDWVQVKAVDKNVDAQYEESFGILLLVCPNPHTEGDAIAHFFAEGASSSFIINRKGLTVTAHYKGRNEVPNTADLGLTDKVRNIVVAGGAMVGISEVQWSGLLKGLLEINSPQGPVDK